MDILLSGSLPVCSRSTLFFTHTHTHTHTERERERERERETETERETEREVLFQKVCELCLMLRSYQS